MTFNNIEAALEAIRNSAAGDAWEWLEREKPDIAAAIRYLIETAKLPPGQVEKYINDIYGVTEPKVQHKMRMIIEALSRGAI